jgi:AraC family transcriptional regulator of adaptative response / DNA-3-methyladenine glycosylase II
LELRIRGGQSSDLLTFASAVRRMFDLSADPARISEVLQRDPALQARVVMRRGLRLAGIWDPFECAVRLIVGHGHSPATTRLLLARLVRCAGQRVAEDAEDLQWLFPHAAALAGADLAGIGLSGETGETLRALAHSLRDLDNGTHHFGEAVLEAVHRLGRPAGASEECLSLFGLGEPDALPCDDDTLRQQLSLGDTPLTRAELEARAELWRPFRGYAAILIWNAAATHPDVPAITAQAVGRFQQRPAQMRKA